MCQACYDAYKEERARRDDLPDEKAYRELAERRAEDSGGVIVDFMDSGDVVVHRTRINPSAIKPKIKENKEPVSNKLDELKDTAEALSKQLARVLGDIETIESINVPDEPLVGQKVAFVTFKKYYGGSSPYTFAAVRIAAKGFAQDKTTWVITGGLSASSNEVTWDDLMAFVKHGERDHGKKAYRSVQLLTPGPLPVIVEADELEEPKPESENSPA